MKVRCLSAAVALGLMAIGGPAVAITPTEGYPQIPFNFSNPGARSLGMGGAFLGSADDATAALVNPAGLTRLGLEQQFSVEYRNAARDLPFVDGGSVSTSPFSLDNVVYRDNSSNNDEISYVAWVLPQDTWAVSIYRHEMVNFQGVLRSGAIAFENDPDGTFIRPTRSKTSLDIVTYGASFAWNATDHISVGAGLTWNDFELKSDLERYDLDGETLALTQRQRGDDSDIGYNIGLLYKGSDNVSFGVSYRSASEFSHDYVTNFIIDGEPLETANATTPFKSPDVFGVGISWRATEQLMINLDINRVGYSNITERVDNPFFSGDFAEFADPQFARSIEIEDTIEPRLGFEYAVYAEVPMFFRGGIWSEKRHNLSFNADPTSLSLDNPAEAVAAAVLYSAGDDELHLSTGFGAVFGKFQLDVAYDRSERLDMLSLSGVYRF